MSDLPVEFIDLMAEKVKLENSINEAIAIFENHFDNAIKIEDLRKIQRDTVCGKFKTKISVSLMIQ